MNDTVDTLDAVKQELASVLAPFIKGYPEGNSAPQFRKKLSGPEAEELLTNIYKITRSIAA